MFVRSQDRKTLVDISGMTIKVKEICFGNFGVIAYGNNQPADETETLGIYDSEERAIDILGDISKNYANYSRRYGGDCSEYAMFDMPED